MRDEEMRHIPDEGEIVSAHTPVGSKTIRLPHCECGLRAIPVSDDDYHYFYSCPEHGYLTHDALLWVVHPIKDVLTCE
jgi:hypothetical protein